MALEAPRNVMVIGLGGTGKWILTYLKQSLIEASNDWIAKNVELKNLDSNYGRSLPEGIKLLCLDLNKAQQIVIDEEIKLDYDPATTEDFAYFGESLVDIKDHVTEKEGPIHPTIGPWFERDDAQKLTLPISELDIAGAGQQKHYCRLCFLKSLTNRDNPRRFLEILPGYFNYFKDREAKFPGIENYFIIVGSLAGGTGSGCILDVAQILKYHIEVGKSLSNCAFIGISILSQAFSTTFRDLSSLQWNLVQSNCVATMRELHRFLVLKDQKYPFYEYKGNWNPFPSLTDKKIPFDAYYLLDGTRPSGGDDLTSFEEKQTVFPAVADYLLNICSQNQMPFDHSNTRTIISNTEEGVFSTLGCHNWIFPVEDIIQNFSIQLSNDYIRFLKAGVPPTYNLKEEIMDFLRNSDQYYCQNAPLKEYFLGKTLQSEKFSFLDDILNIITQYENRPNAIPFDVDYFKEVIFAPNKFPKRFADPKIDVNLIEGYHLPSLNLDQAGQNESDEFKLNEDIRQLTEPAQVIELAERLMNSNLGTNNDPVYDKNNRELRRTYHGILKYYQKIANEVFRGYQDAKGRYFPGLLENRIFLLLNEVKESKPLVDRETGKPDKGEVTKNDRFDMEYQTREFSISLAYNFCIELLNQLEKAKDIIDQGYDMVIRPKGEDQVEIAQEEVNRRRAEYENAGRLKRMWQKSPYLEAMQRLLLSLRLVNMKRYYTAVLEDFMAITRGWKETLENFEKGVIHIGEDLERRLQRFRKIREDKSLFKTRTYVTNPNNPLERDLYEKHIHSIIRKDQRKGGWIDITNQKEFFASSQILIRKKLTDVDSRLDIKRTGRELIVNFKKAPGEAIEPFSPELTIKHAKYFSQGVRNESFWDMILKYRDQNNNLRYHISSGEGFPSQLANDIVKNSIGFIDFRDTLRVTVGPGQQDHNNVIYANWVASEGLGLDMGKFQSSLDNNRFKKKNQYDANMTAGQQYRLTALRQIFCLTKDSFTDYLNICKTYREWLRSFKEASPTVGTPVHNFLGEKYAARYELMIIDRWNEIGLAQPVPDDFFLPLEVVFALENREALKDFLWAGIYFKRLVCRETEHGDEYTIKKNDKFLSLHNPDKPDLLGPLVKFAMSNDPSISSVRKEINDLRKKTFIEKMNTQREEFVEELKGLMLNPLDRMVLLSGTKTGKFKQIIGSKRSEDPIKMSKEEKLEVLFKVIILEQYCPKPNLDKGDSGTT